MSYMEDGIRTRRKFWFTSKKEACVICLDNIDRNLIFCVDNCGHRFCFSCVKQHIEVNLLDGTIPSCPQHRCKSKLSVDRCGKLLTNNLILMWKERIQEDLIPCNKRIYCPYPRCSYLVWKMNNESGYKLCLKCSRYFCVHCKVPWHGMLSCTINKKLHPFGFLKDDDAKLKSLATSKKWCQCGKCQHMIERSSGDSHIKCRCGYVFCYDCGSEWNSFFNHRRGCASSYNHDTGTVYLCVIVICGVLLLVELFVFFSRLF